jgi:hypothetical protein
MKIGMAFRNELMGIPGGSWVVEQFDQVVAGIAAVWRVEHNDDGTHGEIHAGASTFSPTVTITGETGSTTSDTTTGLILLNSDASLTAGVKVRGNTDGLNIESPDGSAKAPLIASLARLTGSQLRLGGNTSSTGVLLTRNVQAFDLFEGDNTTPATLNVGIINAARIALSLGQVGFPATQNPSSDANTLDDYEEFEWTPTLTASGGSSGQTYGSQIGRGVKFGQFVAAAFNLTMTAKGTLTGNVQVGGFPFTSLATITNPTDIFWRSTTTAYIKMWGRMAPGTTVMTLRAITAASTDPLVAVAEADLSNTTTLEGCVVYRASA